MRVLRLLLAAAAALFLTVAESHAERRLALVIGNDAYRNLTLRDQLQNAVGDAHAVRTALEGLGFTVISGENLDRAAMVERLSDFAARLQPEDIAFFFYAGHGVSMSGANYILPSDIAAPHATGRDEEERLADLAMPESRILERIKRSGARVAVVVLDACRDNPLAPTGGRAIGAARGLAPPPETRGVLSLYSAGAGQQALDRLDENDRERNSVFTRVFLRKLQTPGLGLRSLAFETQGEVAALAASVGREQTPGVYSQIIGEDVYLSGRSAPAAAPAPAAPPASDTQQAEFDAAMQTESVAALDAFLAKYPTGALANTARRERDKLKAAKAVATAPRPASGGAQIAALPPSPAPAAVTIAGNWSGRYYYPDGRQSVAFNFRFDGAGCSGRSSEPNTFGAKSAPHLYGNLRCSADHLSPGQTITISKQYDGTGGVSHAVVYMGVVSADLRRISGTWAIGATKGKFSMER
jgi:hypothetical protein